MFVTFGDQSHKVDSSSSVFIMRKLFLILVYILCLSIGALAQDGKQGCPSISVKGPADSVKAGKPVVFTGNVSYEAKNYNPKYEWSIAGGRIVKGQGTLSITVVQPNTGDNLTVTLSVKGLPEDCQNTASATAPVCDCVVSTEVAEFSRDTVEIDELQMQDVKKNAGENPNSQLFVMEVFRKGTPQDEIDARILRLENYLTQVTSIDKDRLKIVKGLSDRNLTRIYLVPPGAEEPACDECTDFAKSCPAVSLSGPEGLTRVGENIVVKATVSPDNQADIKYLWSVDKGKILKGQGSPEVVIDTDEIQPREQPTNVEVKLAIDGPPDGCRSIISERYPVFRIFDFTPASVYGNIPFLYEKAWLDNLAVNILNTSNTGYIVKYFGKKVSDKEIKARVKRIEDFMFKSRKYPKGRFRIIVKRDNETFTKLWSFPPDAEPPID